MVHCFPGVALYHTTLYYICIISIICICYVSVLHIYTHILKQVIYIYIYIQVSSLVKINYFKYMSALLYCVTIAAFAPHSEVKGTTVLFVTRDCLSFIIYHSCDISSDVCFLAVMPMSLEAFSIFYNSKVMV